MKKFMNWFVGEESGQSMVEYGLIIGLIAVVLIASLTAVNGSLQNMFAKITNELGNVAP